jgi:ADP-heptose:LPS heptosyltransferase
MVAQSRSQLRPITIPVKAAGESLLLARGFLDQHDGNSIHDGEDTAAARAQKAGLVVERADGLAAGRAAEDLEESRIHGHTCEVYHASILRRMLALPAPLQAMIEARGAGLTVLVLRLGAMGDIVRTLPPVRLVRAGLPEARIHWVAWHPWDKLLEGHADLDGVIALPRGRIRSEARSPLRWPSLLRSLTGLALDLRGLRAGLVLDFHGDLRTGALGWLSGAGVRIGYEGHQQKEGNRHFNTHRVPSGDRRTPRMERNLDLVRALGLPDRPLPSAGIAIGPEDEAAAADIVRGISGEGRDYAVLNPGASSRQAYKKPPPSLLGAAARALVEAGVTPLLVSGPGEDADAERAAVASGGLARRTPATTLKSLAALLARARIFVGGDSGPLHLACGVGCPVLGIYGPTDPVVNTPWGVPFLTLARPGSRHTGIKARDRAEEGFHGLEADAVAKAVRTLLSRPRESSGGQIG